MPATLANVTAASTVNTARFGMVPLPREQFQRCSRPDSDHSYSSKSIQNPPNWCRGRRLFAPALPFFLTTAVSCDGGEAYAAVACRPEVTCRPEAATPVG